ncbi:MAG: hypothetical protein REH83_05470 [Rickettsiella sp.]|nr:hypothetical protein [Rickettsiella sp.]
MISPYIVRPGPINAWDDEDSVNDVKRNWAEKVNYWRNSFTNVCIAFPAISAIVLSL